MSAEFWQTFGYAAAHNANQRKRKGMYILAEISFLKKNREITRGPFDLEKMAADDRDNKSIGEIGVYR